MPTRSPTCTTTSSVLPCDCTTPLRLNNGQNPANRHAPDGVCHMPYCAHRVLRGESVTLRAAFATALQRLGDTGATGGSLATKTVLDICDASHAGLLAAAMGANRVVCLEDMLDIYTQLKHTVGVPDSDNVIPWAGATHGEPWNVDAWGMVDVLIGDGYFARLATGAPLWQPLQFWYLRTAVDAVLAPTAVVIPSKVHIMASVVSFENLWESYKPVGTIAGLDHSRYEQVRADAQSASSGVTAMDPLPLWQYPSTCLSPPQVVATLNTWQPIDFESTDSLAMTTVTNFPMECGRGHQRPHAIVFWNDYNLQSREDGVSFTEFDQHDFRSKCVGDETPRLPDVGLQSVRWLHDCPLGLLSGNFNITLKCTIDLRAADMDFEVSYKTRVS